MKGSNIRFHRFPYKRSEILSKWVVATDLNNFKPSLSSRLCSAHFKEDDYRLRPGAPVKLLKLDAVPSIFSFPDHLMKEQKTRKIIKRHQLQTIEAMKRSEVK